MESWAAGQQLVCSCWPGLFIYFVSSFLLSFKRWNPKFNCVMLIRFFFPFFFPYSFPPVSTLKISASNCIIDGAFRTIKEEEFPHRTAKKKKRKINKYVRCAAEWFFLVWIIMILQYTCLYHHVDIQETLLHIYNIIILRGSVLYKTGDIAL